MSRLIVGLGNPGKEYIHTRHNLGFLVVQDLAKRYKIPLLRNFSLKSYSGEGTIEHVPVRLLLPFTFMNNSGIAVKEALESSRHASEEFLVVVDDFHLAFGKLRFRLSGSDGGHNGLRSVIEHLGTTRFARLRLGIGSPVDKDKVVDFVLSEFSPQEKKKLDAFIEEAIQCGVAWLTTSPQAVMNQYNKRKGNE